MVPNIEQAKQWYAKAFDTQPYFDESFYAGFNIGGYELGLSPEETPSIKGDNVFSYWGVDNIEKSYRDFVELGAREHEKPNNVGGEIMVASLYDPWDNIIGLIYNPEFKLKD